MNRFSDSILIEERFILHGVVAVRFKRIDIKKRNVVWWEIHGNTLHEDTDENYANGNIKLLLVHSDYEKYEKAYQKEFGECISYKRRDKCLLKSFIGTMIYQALSYKS